VTPQNGGFKIDGSLRQDDARTLVLALGLGRFTPRRLGLPDEDRFLGKGLAYRLPPLEQVRARRAVVVGGGDTALDTALSLREVADVTVVRRRDEFRAYAHTQDRFADAGIEVLSNGEVVGLKGEDRLESIVIRRTDGSTDELPADLVLVSIGQVPDLSGIEHWGLGLRGAKIDVDSTMATGLPGVFAVGDFALYPGKVRMIATAVAEGTTAAASAQRYLSAD
jgi:thioredoxin reductase